MATKMLVIAVSGLDWPGLVARIAGGELTTLGGLARRGGARPIRPFCSDAGVAEFVSLATGQSPENHGVWMAQEPWEGGLRPVGRASWRCAPVWARLEAAGISTGSVGWPASRPGSAWPGLHIDDSFALASGLEPKDWALPRQAAPFHERAALYERRVHPSQITGAMLAPLMPDWEKIDQRRDARLPQLAVAMAEASTIQAAATWLLRDRSPDAVFAYQPWLGAVRQAAQRCGDLSMQKAVEGAWRFLDASIASLMNVAGEAATVVILSPGWSGRSGALLIGGKAHFTHDAGVVDVLDAAPTILARFSLSDSGALGRNLLVAPPPSREAPPAIPEAVVEPNLGLLAQATRAGYQPPSSPPRRWRVDRLCALGRLLFARDASASLRLAVEAHALDPDHLGAIRLHARALVALGLAEGLPALAIALDRLAPTRGWGAVTKAAYYVLQAEPRLALEPLKKAEQDLEIETQLQVASLWYSANRADKAIFTFTRVLECDPTNALASVGVAMCALAQRDFRRAEAALTKALKDEPGNAAAYLQFARMFAMTGQAAKAGVSADAAVRFGANDRAAAAAASGNRYP